MEEVKDQKQVLADAASTLLNEPTIITVDILNPNKVQKFFMFLRLLPKHKRYEVKAACTATMIRISKHLLEVDISALKDSENYLTTTYGLMSKHGMAMCRVIATAIHNGEKEPPESLVNFILSNVTAAEMRTIFTVVLHKIDIENFMISIMSSTGMNLLKPKG